MPTITDLRQTRIDKLESLKKKGIDPYPPTAQRDHRICDARKEDGTTVACVGRVMGKRGHGKIYFFDLKDESGSIQVVCKADVLAPAVFSLSETLDIGDFISVKGMVGKTQAGEISIIADVITLLSKSLRPLPDQWYGLKDVEERYRKRYVDLLLNPSVRQVLDARFTMERAIRTFLWDEGYTEVETPILQPLYGGTNAKPFTTHMNALDTDFYLRVAPELYLKRLIVGGYERVFEIARNFRNEGIDLTHQPEFTMIEYYEAYADYNRIMDLTEDLIKHAAQAVNHNYIVQIHDHTIDISGKWKRMTIDEALQEYADISWDEITDDEIMRLCEQHAIIVQGEKTRAKTLFALYDHLVTPQLIDPTWVTDYPRDVSPLSRAHRLKPDRVERFEGYVGGKEICDGWSEIISGLEQRIRFESEQKNMRAGDTEAQPLDEEFIETLEYGCPPLGGIGIGIDRLCMLLTNTWAIREVIAFPTLRPEVRNEKQEKDESFWQTSQRVRPESDSGVVLKSRTPQTDKTRYMDLGISYPDAQKLLEEYIKDPVTRMHCIESEAIMRTLAGHFKENEEQWGIIGLLHDIDWELTKTDTKQHCIKCVEILKSHGGTEFLIDTIQSHGFGQGFGDDYYGPPEFKGKTRETTIQHALAAAETLTGLIIATTLIQPDKKLLSVKSESLIKKYKNKAFAANCRRTIIAECEQIGLPIDQFLGLGLKALQDIHEKLGL